MDKTTIYIGKDLREKLKIIVAKLRMKDYDELLRYFLKNIKEKNPRVSE